MMPFAGQGGLGFVPPVTGQPGLMDLRQAGPAGQSRRDDASVNATAGSGNAGMTLVGELIVDGRQLGTVVAREQTRQAMLPSTRGSGIDVGSMPLYRSNSPAF